MMVENIFLLRHGETESDKTRTERKLTDLGKEQSKLAGIKIRGLTANSAAGIEIYTSDALRTRMVAEIVSRELRNRSFREFSNMRIKNIDQFAELVGGENLLAKYFDYYNRAMLPRTVQTPGGLVNEFFKNIYFANENTRTLIIVGHGVSLETFAYSQKVFIPMDKDARELGYGEVLELRKAQQNE